MEWRTRQGEVGGRSFKETWLGRAIALNALYWKDGLGTWEGEEGTTMQQGWKRGVSMKQCSTVIMVELESICRWIDNHEITVIDNGDIRSGMVSKKAWYGWRNHVVTVVRTGDREGHSQHPIPTPWKGRKRDDEALKLQAEMVGESISDGRTWMI